MLAALVFVLARNIIKLVVERRRALPFARFRAKLVALLLGMTLVPARARADRRQRADSHERRSAGSTRRWTRSCRRRTRLPATTTTSGRCSSAITRARLARALSAVDLAAPTCGRSATCVAPDVTLQRVQMVQVLPRRSGRRTACRASSRSSTWSPPGCRPATAARPPIGWRRRRWPARADTRSIETLGSSGDLLHAAAVDPVEGRHADRRRRRDRLPDRRPRGALAPHDAGVRELQPAARAQAAADRRLPVVLPDGDAADPGRLDLDGAVPGQADHAARCRCWPRRRARSAPGRLDQRVEPQSNDEFGSLVEAFNAMAGELAASRRKVDRSTDRARAQAPGGGRPAALHRDDPRAHHDRRGLGRRRRRDHHDQQRGGAAARPDPIERRPAGPGGVRRAPICSRSRPCSPAPGGAAASRRPRRSPSRATARSCTSPSSRRRWSAKRARRKARCWCSTTSRR